MNTSIQRISVGGKNRYSGVLASDAPQKTLEDILLEVDSSSVLLWDGEPTLRSDFPQLLTALKEKCEWVGICTDGILLQQSNIVEYFKGLGLDAVFILIPSFQRQYNSWLIGPGRSKKALAGLKTAGKGGLEAYAEVPLTRSMMHRLSQTCMVLDKQGVKQIFLHPIESKDESLSISLSPRIGLMERIWSEFRLAQSSMKAKIVIEGIPQELVESIHHETCFFSDKAYVQYQSQNGKTSWIGRQYIQRFGWFECKRASIEAEIVPHQLMVIDPTDSSRDIRKHLVQIAQTLPKSLEVHGSFEQENIYSVLRDILRLNIEELWLCGDLSALARLTKLEWFRLKSIKGLMHHLTDASCPELICELFQRTSRQEHRLLVDIHSLEDLRRYDQAWNNKEVPIAPHFKLSADLPLADVIAIASELSPEIQVNLRDVLPPCLDGVDVGQRYIRWSLERDREKQFEKGLFSGREQCSQSNICLKAKQCCGVFAQWPVRAIVEDA